MKNLYKALFMISKRSSDKSSTHIPLQLRRIIVKKYFFSKNKDFSQKKPLFYYSIVISIVVPFPSKHILCPDEVTASWHVFALHKSK